MPTTARMRVFAGPVRALASNLGRETMSKEDDIRLDQKVRAAWMYYIAGQNQSEIASQLGTLQTGGATADRRRERRRDCVD